MLFEDTYKTIEKAAEGSFKDRGSKFISVLHPLYNENEIKTIIKSLREIHPKARHFCWASRLSTDRSVFRVNDDGEPSGSAGKPILNTLYSNELTNVLAVVVRYFGGTLLGIPGLVQAYKTATIEGINNAVIIERTLNAVYQLNFGHSQMNDVMRIIKDENISVLESGYDEQAILSVEIRQSQVEPVIRRLENLKNIKVKFVRVS